MTTARGLYGRGWVPSSRLLAVPVKVSCAHEGDEFLDISRHAQKRELPLHSRRHLDNRGRSVHSQALHVHPGRSLKVESVVFAKVSYVREVDVFLLSRLAQRRELLSHSHIVHWRVLWPH